MTLEDLRIFAAVVEARNMSEVARAAGTTQPAVAQHVRRLEREFGAPLLTRTPRGVQPTEVGDVLYEHASTALSSLGNAAAEIEARKTGASGRLALAATTGTVRHYLQPALLAFKRTRPDLELHLECGNTVAQRLDAIRERRADLAFVELSQETPGFERRTVVEMPLVLLVHRDDPLGKRTRIDLPQLEKIRYVSVGRDSTTFRFVEGHLAGRGRRLVPHHTVDTEGTAILYAELGLGHTLVPAVQAAALERRSELRAITVRGLPPVPVGWAARSFAHLPSAPREFMETFDRLHPSPAKP